MKEYIKPAIEVVTLASATPIAAKTCTSMTDSGDWDFVAREVRNEFGEVFVDYEWINGQS